MSRHSTRRPSARHRVVAAVPPAVRILRLAPERARHADRLVVLREELVVVKPEPALVAAEAARVEEVAGRRRRLGVARRDPDVALAVAALVLDLGLAVEADGLGGGCGHDEGLVNLLGEVREGGLCAQLVCCLCGEEAGLGLAVPLLGVRGAAGAARGVLLVGEQSWGQREEAGESR